MQSDAANWDQLQDLFHLIEGTPEAERDRILRDACPEPNLRQRVFALLESAARSEISMRDATAQAHSGGLRVGEYVTVRTLGSGGMGTVYLAERNTGGVVQQVALKVLSPHAAGPDFLDRFLREQRILASLEHPNITRMLDAGFDGVGQPYLAMEYVAGEHLDQFCDKRKLTIEDRLRIFLRICDAITYAHRNLVVHLDLKPSNVLVMDDCTPKVLDFGASKLIQSDGRITATTPLTACYASPEQLRNENLTTSSDIYSLGIILYELLAGQRPSGEASLAGMIERALDEKEPPRLDSSVTEETAARRALAEGRLKSLLSGDLSSIVRKCLRPRLEDRYASVHALSEDIQRYLEGRPVLAQRQTAFYQVSKFVRRHRGEVAVSLLTFIALGAALSYAWWGHEQALREGQRAVRMQSFLYRLFKMANSNYTGKPTATLPEFLRLGVKVLPGYIHDAGDLRHAELALAESMFWNRDLDSAQQVYVRVAAAAQAAGDAPAEAEALAYSAKICVSQEQKELAMSRSARALELSRKTGVPPRIKAISALSYAIVREEMGQLSEENLGLAEFGVRESRQFRLPPHEIGQALYYQAAFLQNHGRLAEAEGKYEEALREEALDPLTLCDQSDILYGLAGVRRLEGKLMESEPYYRRAYEAHVTCSGAEAAETLWVGASWAGALVETGRAHDALPVLEKALPSWRNSALRGNLDFYLELHFLAAAYLEEGRYAEALPLAEESWKILAARLPGADRRIGSAHLLLARILKAQNRYGDALPHAEAADRILAPGGKTPYAESLRVKAHAVLEEVRVHTSSK